MRLVTYEAESGSPQLGAVVENEVIQFKPRNSGDKVFASMRSLLEAGEVGLARAREVADSPASSRVDLKQVRLLAPVANPSKIIAVGLNYRDHARELNVEPPATPIIFAKFSSSITGPGAPVLLPAGDVQLDYEAELAVVIGRRGKSILAADAMEYVAGYMPLNDISARKWQFADQQWVRGKSCDTFCPIGPWLTTRDEVPDPHALAIKTRVNGEFRQNSNTSNLIFRVPELVAFISAAITLHPGDIIATGTPDGVGVFRKPPVFLQTGDVVEVEIENLGLLKNRIEGPQHPAWH
ncbi:MAG: fumarylacetoacetate hydrolase family protein [Acidobacteriota bacterium]